MTVDGRSLKAYPDLKETVWVKNATMAPNGQYDKIGLHRLVKTGITPKGVVFLTNCPMWGTGETRISNPPSDNWTKNENFSQAIYWANRGFDVYAIDYRTHFVPQTLNVSQMSFAANWGWDVWVSDIKETAEKVKAVSGNSKFYIAGECSGGAAALNYATKYWKTDLKGIILLDADFPLFVLQTSYPIVGRITETNTYNVTKAINDMNAMENWTYAPLRTIKPLATYALQNPGAPAQYPPGTPLAPPINPLTNKTWANITEWFGVMTYLNFAIGVTPTSPAGMLSNIMGGYGNVSQVEYNFANSESVPTRLFIETAAMIDWVNCPYLTYDFNDHYNEIGVPVLAFATALFSNRTGTFRFVNGIANPDFTGIMLPNYGHVDTYYGTYSARDVSQPALDWMRGQLVGLKATAFCNVTVMPGWTWWFFAHGTGGVGTCTYQWYEGTTLLQGQTAMVLPVTKNTPGTYTFYCKVMDSESATAYSSAVTLTVR
jgi:pimeloyl-ACP methyl ester carboxylesterase